MAGGNNRPLSRAEAAAARREARRLRANGETAVVKDASPLKKKEIEKFHTLLVQRRREVLGDVEEMAEEAMASNRQESAGELSSMPIHMADVGTDNYEHEFTLGLIETDRQVLRDIDLALEKMRGGKYGICEGTGEPIGRARLTAMPEARYCIEYARKLEDGLVEPPLTPYDEKQDVSESAEEA